MSCRLSYLLVQQLLSLGWMYASALAFWWLQRPPVTIDLMNLVMLNVTSSTSARDYRKLTLPTQESLLNFMLL